MERLALLILAALTLLGLPALAGPAPLPRDVPVGHWAAHAVRRVTARRLMTPAPDGKFHGDRPVTRYELAVTLDRFVRDIEAARRPLSAGPDAPTHFHRPRPAAADASLRHLVGGGFLPASSPLVVKDGARPATAQELADALAQVTIRLSDRSLPPQKE